MTIADSPVGSMGMMLVPGPCVSFPGWVTAYGANSHSKSTQVLCSRHVC